MILRLDPVLAERLRMVAQAEGRTVSDVVRQAVADHVERRLHDDEFRSILEDNITRYRELLDGTEGAG
jgi:predicted transcriptional regulator